jgi:S1-C subfamily serine protease
MKIEKNIFLVILCSLLLSSCAYHGNLKKEFYTSSFTNTQKIPISVSISKSDRYINKIKTSGALGDTYEFDVKDGILGAVSLALSGIIDKVYDAGEQHGEGKPDFLVETILEVDLVHKDNWSGTQIFQSNLELVFREYDTQREVARYYDKQKAHHEPSAASTALGVLTGASLFLLAPITVPAGAQIEGSKGLKLLEETLSKSLDGIVNDIQRDKRKLIFEKSRIGKDTSIDKTEKEVDEDWLHIPSKYEDFLNCVVVVRSSNGVGTGFFVTNEGYIVTNNHVVGNDSSVSIKLRNGRTILGDVMSTVRDRDLALIKVEGDNFSWLALGKITDAGVGNDVIAIGTPEGLDWSVSKGIISAVRNFDGIAVVQTDTAINHGNSGGPLILLKNGKVIGVNTFGFRKDIAEGLSFAISSREVIKILPQIQE